MICKIFAAICVVLLPGGEWMSAQDNPTNVGSESTPVDTGYIWDFNRWNDPMGWTVPEEIMGGVTGGTLWITVNRDKTALGPASWRQQVWGQNLDHELVSPGGLAIPAAQYTKVKLRLLNLSPETDGLVIWENTGNPGKDGGEVRFSMKPDCREWQEVVCHIDDNWNGSIDRIRIRPAMMWMRGDIWIDQIAVVGGLPREQVPRPDLYSEAIVPLINIPGIAQEDFRDAFKVLDECMVTDVPMRGFNYPFLAPGGAYGHNWWQLDGCLNVAGAKWVNRELVENIMRGYTEVQDQNPDGRIDPWGGAPIRGQAADVSSIPRYFEAAWDVVRQTDDHSLREEIYATMKKYLGYWFSPFKQDATTGLITAVFEESFPPVEADPGIVAAVDLNVAVAIGCRNTALLAGHLGYVEEARFYSDLFVQLAEDINRYLWNGERGVYLDYNVVDKIHFPRLVCSTFDPMQLGIAPDERIEKLLPTLLDPKPFNWGIRPVTSIARTEPGYVEAVGAYDGTAWLGDIWTMKNIPIVRGLQDAGRHDLAAELNWSTINTFNANYCEYVVPSTGSGEGVLRYGWTASQYIQAVIEHVFGVDYNLLNKRLRILPHIPEELMGQEISLSNLILPCGVDTKLDLSIKQQGEFEAVMDIRVSGSLPEGDMEVFLPVSDLSRIRVTTGKREELPIVREVEGLRNIAGIRIPVSETVSLRFSR